MIKKIVLASVGLLLVSPFLVSATTISANSDLSDDYGTGATQNATYCPKLSTTMEKGARDSGFGGQVSELQAFLTSYFNLDENIVVGGYFGNLTQKYLIQFQQKNNLPAYGIAGSLTRAKIKEVCGTPASNISALTTESMKQGTHSRAEIELFRSSGAVRKCTSTSMVMYVAFTKILIETAASKGLYSDGYMYTWQNNSAKGGKYPYDISVLSKDSAKRYTCTDWAADSSLFVIPSTINFSDQAKLEEFTRALAQVEPLLFQKFSELLQKINASTRTDIPNLRLFASAQGERIVSVQQDVNAVRIMPRTASIAELDAGIAKIAKIILTKQILIAAYSALPGAELELLMGVTGAPAVSCELFSSPASIKLGESITLTWKSANVTAGGLWIDDNVTPFGTAINLELPSGARTFTPPAAGTVQYRWEVVGPGTSTKCVTYVTVTPHLSPTPTPAMASLSISVPPTPGNYSGHPLIASGASTVVSWKSTNMSSCSVRRGNPSWAGNYDGAKDTGWSGTSGSRETGPLTETDGFYLRCMTPEGQPYNAQVFVYTFEPTAAAVSISAGYANTTSANGSLTGPVGQAASLWWSSAHAKSCVLSRSPTGQLNYSGTATYSNTRITIESMPVTYTITCTGSDGGKVSASVMVNPQTAPTEVGGAFNSDQYAQVASVLAILESALNGLRQFVQ